jgi:D-alanine--poly(phosphoribitol) ligase subunit 1
MEGEEADLGAVRPTYDPPWAANAPSSFAVPSRACDPPTSLYDLFLASCRAYEDRPALWVEGCALSYVELCDAAARLAAAIRAGRSQIGGHDGRQCALLVNRTPTAYAAVLASMRMGSAYMPLNPRFPTERLRDALLSSAVDTIIVDHRSMAAAAPLLKSFPRPLTVLLPDAAAPQWPTHPSGSRYFARAEIEQMAPAPYEAQASTEYGAYLLFTSGSTGTPKGVLISHANALTYIQNVAGRYRPGPRDRFSQLFDFSFDLSVHDMFLAWSAGACLYCAPEGSLVGLGDFIRRCALTFWFSVPSTAAFMRKMHMLRPGSYPSLRWSLFCGEALPMQLARTWQAAAPNSLVENLYGPTEATVAFTAYRLPNQRGNSLDTLQTVPIGIPLPGQKAIVIDGDGKPLADGEAGELCLAGSQVAAGYWHPRDKTVEPFQPPRSEKAAGMLWYRTGDRAVMKLEHGLIFLGRIDRQAKIRGHRVDLLEVENAVRAAAGADTVAAVPWPIVEDGLALGLVGFVAGSEKTAAEIIEKCRIALPEYMVPNQIHRIIDWPINANGKTDYRSLVASLQNDNAEL